MSYSATHRDRLSLMTWNIESGGFETYHSSETVPARETPILQTIEQAKQEHTVGLCALIDTYKWRAHYGNDEAIASHLGFASVNHVELDDESLTHDGREIGVTLASDYPVAEMRNLDLGTRQASGMILDIGNDGVQVAAVYLDHSTEERRLAQMRALLNELEPSIPTIITGDLNTLRPIRLLSADTLRACGLLTLASTMLANGNRGAANQVFDMTIHRKCISLAKDAGYIDAGEYNPASTYQRDIAGRVVPILSVDYVLHSDGFNNTALEVNATDYSDHRPVLFTSDI